MRASIVCDVANNLRAKLDAFFVSLPRSRGLSVETFYSHKLRVLKLSESTRRKLRRKEVRGSASAEEAIASIKDDFARDVVVDWVLERKKAPRRMLPRC